MLLLFLTWKHDDCFIPQLGQHLQSSKTPDLKPKDEWTEYHETIELLFYNFKNVIDFFLSSAIN